MIQHLSELQYDTDLSGCLRLYIYRADGLGYEKRTYFARKVKYPDEEIDMEAAKSLCDNAVLMGREVRITNSGDFLIFHAKSGEVLWPLEGSECFWKRVRGAK
jgi:hypothetical protein